MRYAFNVTLDIPDNITRDSVQAYVADAIATMMGCYHPASPILQTKSVTVRGKGLAPIVETVSYSFYDPDFDI